MADIKYVSAEITIKFNQIDKWIKRTLKLKLYEGRNDHMPIYN